MHPAALGAFQVLLDHIRRTRKTKGCTGRSLGLSKLHLRPWNASRDPWETSTFWLSAQESTARSPRGVRAHLEALVAFQVVLDSGGQRGAL